jgi:ubiquinol-cytochrome c reductase iron-sulfur subunit
VRSPTRLPLVLLTVSALASVALFVVYLTGGQPQLEGALLGTSLGGIGGALILWGKRVLPADRVTAERFEPSTEEERARAEAALSRGAEAITRRRALIRALAVAGGALVGALLLPIRSLGPSPGRALFTTPWSAGTKVVDEEGRPIVASTFRTGQVLTVFPEGHVGSADGQAVLMRVEASTLRLPAGRDGTAPEGLVAYSKICTHAGCPVALYLESTQQLRCPCHQSTFSVLEGGVPQLGPAARPLPQLPLEVGEDGALQASGGFTDAVGPSFWELG